MSEIWWVLLIIIPLACLIVLLSIDNHYQGRRIERLKQKIERQKLEIDGIKSALRCEFDPIECEEVHLPNDCPLCGAD